MGIGEQFEFEKTGNIFPEHPENVSKGFNIYSEDTATGQKVYCRDINGSKFIWNTMQEAEYQIKCFNTSSNSLGTITTQPVNFKWVIEPAKLR